MGLREFREETFDSLHCMKHFSRAKLGPGATKYLQMLQKTPQENGSLVSDLTPRQTDGFAAIALLSSPLLQLK